MSYHFRKNFYSDEIDYRSACNFIVTRIPKPEFHGIPLSDHFHTLLHFVSYFGDEASLNEILNPNILITLHQDMFGKSPIFYAIKKKHFKCAQLFLKYFIDNNLDQNLFTLILSRLQNDFLLIIESSFQELPEFLNLFLLTTDYTLTEERNDLPKLMFTRDNKPLFSDFGQFQNQGSMPVCIKYCIISLPNQTYSFENMKMLESLISCKNPKIYENVLIKNIINHNWNEVIRWMILYSILTFLNIVLLTFGIVYGRTNLLIIIPFVILNIILLIWEVLQIISSKSTYFDDIWNYVDIFMIILIFYWIAAGFLECESIFEEYSLALLIITRGLTGFRIINGTRYYTRLIFAALDNIKYFLTIFLYSTFFFTVLLFILNGKGLFKISNMWEIIWTFNFTGEHQIDSNSSNIFLTYITFIFAAIINVILMLNLLISILGDTYDCL